MKIAPRRRDEGSVYARIEQLTHEIMLQYDFRWLMAAITETKLPINPLDHFTLDNLRLVNNTTVHTFPDLVRKQIQQFTEDILQPWYQTLCEIFSNPNVFKDVKEHKAEHVHKLINEYIRSKIILMKEQIIEHIIEIATNVHKTPILDLSIRFKDGRIKPVPDHEMILSSYCRMIALVADMAMDIPRFEVLFPFESENVNYIYTSWTDNYLSKKFAEMNAKLLPFFIPLIKYCRCLEERYGELAPGFIFGKALPDSSEFDALYDIYLHYTELRKTIFLLPGIEFIHIFKLHQKQLKLQLGSLCSLRLKEATLNAKSLALRNAKTLSLAINTLLKRITIIPKTSKEFVFLGSYMTTSAPEMMEVLRNKVDDTIKSFFSIQYNLTIHDIMAVKDLILEYNELIDAEENFKPLYDITRMEIEDQLSNEIDKLNRDLEEFVANYLDNFNDLDNDEYIAEYVQFVLNYARKLDQFDERVAWINSQETIYNAAASTYPELDEIKSIVNPFSELILFIYQWNTRYKAWLDGPLLKLSAAEIEDELETFIKTIFNYNKNYKQKCRQHLADNYPKRFKGIVDDLDFNVWPAPIKLIFLTQKKMKELKRHMPIISYLCNQSMQERHWNQLSEEVGFDAYPYAGRSLRSYLDEKIEETSDKVEVISTGATKELQLQENFEQMKAEWEGVNFGVGVYKDTEIPILASVEDVQALLDDHLIKTLSMRGSAFVKPIEEEVKVWYNQLERLNTTIEEWGKVQIQWLYLLPIFSSKDIINEMPTERRLFLELDVSYRDIILSLYDEPSVLKLIQQDEVPTRLKTCLDKLETVNKGVNLYLEEKRLFFPRFFFLSNDGILEILSERTDPTRVQPHLKACFEGISKLGFDEKLNIFSMFSEEGEEVQYLRPISTEAARGNVEKWLIKVEKQMVEAVKERIFSSCQSYNAKTRHFWVHDWQGQIVLCVSQIFWTAEVHELFSRKNQLLFEKYYAGLSIQLNNLVKEVRTQLPKQVRITIEALIVLDIHARDVVMDLCSNEVSSAQDFKWQCQMRYYLEDDVKVRLLNATINYAYEYLGNTTRLVITPLTDRCYRTLIGAYHLHLNGAPEGPAGTGKTETTKDLAKAIAVQCIVFNCSDGLDYRAMGKFFKGLASCGAWACFDEFNRIEVEVLSVIAQQILCIIQAVRAKIKKFFFEDTMLTLNPAVYVCITMNPGYAGRSELPDNLKVLFRTVAMMVPDYAMIGEITLYSHGYLEARELSVKIVTTYRLCSEQLSSQFHYDYGMRAVKTVLAAAGNLKRRFPDEGEAVLVLRSIIDVNLPKFLNQDVPLFNGIISDLFPTIEIPPPSYEEFLSALEVSCARRNLQPLTSFSTKVIQTYEMMIVRHGFMLVGDPFAGKTCTLNVLADTLTIMNERGLGEAKTYFVTLNPKAVTMGQLYGCFDEITYEWQDGIIATYFRLLAIADDTDRKWLVFDGPVDAVWIENMNTVLDDNKKLCLNSGEVIQMKAVMSMIFEVMDLSQASPATVSRCGMIYMQAEAIGWKPFVQSWNNTIPEEWKNKNNPNSILEYFYWLIPPLIKFVSKHGVKLVDAGVINCVKTSCQLMEMLLTNSTDNYLENVHFMHWINAALAIGIYWGIGGTLDMKSLTLYDAYFRKLWDGGDDDNPPKITDRLDMRIPDTGLFHDYSFVFKGRGQFIYMPDTVKTFKFEDIANVRTMLVPTAETAMYMWLMSNYFKKNVPFLLVGPTGTGKSFYIQNMLMNELSLSEFSPSVLSFSPSITANQTQDLIISKLVKKRKGIYGAPLGKVNVIFIDDINMPAKETYGAQPPLELLRQYFDFKQWYDLKDTTKLRIMDTFFVAAMGLPGGSRQHVYARFLRHFNLFAINAFSDESTFNIFSTMLFVGYKKVGFAADIKNTINSLVSATMRLYELAISFLLPTPTKFHYLFNLRDIIRVVSGLLLITKESVETKKSFIRLWVHEVLRVFHDRLIDSQDRKWFFDQLPTVVEEEFKESYEMSMDELEPNNEPLTEKGLRNLIFTSAMDVETDEKKYEEIPSVEVFEEFANEMLNDYNSENKTKLDIVLFRYAIEHLSRICRILRTPGGSGLLVGVSGCGRQSLTKLAAYICNLVVFQPEITKNYGFNDWRNDLKDVLRKAGGRNKQTVFLFTEGQVKGDYNLQDIDALLNSGEVPNIFALDEIQEIIELVREAAETATKNKDLSTLVVYNHFITRCKANLHLVLCFSPIGSALRNRVRMYPSLVNCSTIDWYEAWPEDALKSVAEVHLRDANVGEELKTAVIEVCQVFHVTARDVSKSYANETGKKTYITSASYLDLIQLYKILLKKKQEEVIVSRDRYTTGLSKLQFAAQQVYILQKELEELRPQLSIAIEDTQQMLTGVEKEKIAVDKASALVREDEREANIKAEAASELRRECVEDLAQAIPILEDAIAALNTLKPSDITLVKSMKNPPDAVKLVMAAICVMKEIKPDRIPDPHFPGRKMNDYWGPSKRMLGDMGFLQSLKEYDKDNIPAHIMNVIRRQYLSHKDFKPKVVAKASSAAEGLCMWVIAMDKYDTVVKMVAPKKVKLAQAEQEFEGIQKLLDDKRAQLAVLEEQLAKLNTALVQATEKKFRLQNEVNLCAFKLEKAQIIIGNLGGEEGRWREAAANLQNLYDCLAGDILVSSGIIAYLAPFPAKFRNKVLDEWSARVKKLKIPLSPRYTLENILGNQITIQDWTLTGLPADSFSINNAIIMENSNRWPLFIDPQGQAAKWIKSLEQDNELLVIRLTNDNYMRKLEKGIKFGKPVLLENLGEELDPALDPLLFKQTFKQGQFLFISLGDSVVRYDDAFKFYMATKYRNPHYLPEIFNKVTIINFSLSVDGLSDQLLGIVVSVERPDLQAKRQALITQCANFKKLLRQAEDDILLTLSSVKGNILEDETAVLMLEHSKSLAADLYQKQIVAERNHEMMETTRMKYKPVSVHAATLYYTITELPNVHSMYQFSLTWFINIYLYSIDTSQKSPDLSQRLRYLADEFDYNLYLNVSRSLFDKDKILYSFILCTTLLLYKKLINQEDLDFLITGGIALDNPLPNPVPNWLPDKAWDEICRLNNLSAFKGYLEDFKKNSKDWEKFYNLSAPSIEDLPEKWKDKTSLQKLILMRIFRADQLIPLIIQFVADSIGQRFIEPPTFDLSRSYNDSKAASPLVFILSRGVDPMYSLLGFAQKMNYSHRFHTISLGQGQGPIAERLMNQATETGDWVCLQNCHLAISWLPRLEFLCEQLTNPSVHSSFRLWLTSYPTESFPDLVLQEGVKITNEAPTGLQQNLLRSYTSEPVSNKDFYESCPEKVQQFTRLLFGITFFHAVVQERRKFGPLGWNIAYDFNESDFQISVQQLQMYIEEQDQVPFSAILYLTGECNYGGRVTDYWDRRTLNTLLKEYINTEIINQENYNLCDGADVYSLPGMYGYKDYLNYIKQLPKLPEPEVYGFHSNAGITKNLAATKELLSSVLSTTGGNVGGASKNVENLIQSMTKEILNKLPPGLFDIHAASARYPTEYKESMNTVLVQEMERFNNLHRIIKSSLVELQKAVKGSIVMTSELESIGNSLLISKIPHFWAKASYPCLKPVGSYIIDFVKRLQFFQDWYEEGKPYNFWLSGFFFTQAFLTGTMQNYARQYKIPIDLLSFDFEIMEKEATKHPENGVYVYGLFIDGARWDREMNYLVEQLPLVLSDTLPQLWIKPIKREHLDETNRYVCPLYKTSERKGVLSTTGHSTNYVLPVLLDTYVHPSHWIKRGVALLCQLDN